MAKDMGVRIHHYHADNGRFTDKGFIQDCQKQHQGITYCGVNAHVQNGIAEKKIWDLQEQMRAMMLHALRKWSSMLSVHLWPYGLCTANNICNSTPHKGSNISPIELFSGVWQCALNLNTITLLAAPHMYSIRIYKHKRTCPSGKVEQGSACTWGHHLTTHAA